MIGVGGGDSAETALEIIAAGAHLVQLYTRMINAVPALPARILSGMDDFMRRESLGAIGEYRGRHLDRWADKNL
jgi:dihydroorotate dehydrogenase